MDLKLSAAREQLSCAISAYANAQTAARDITAAVDMQRTTVQQLEADLQNFSDIDNREALIKAQRVKAKVKGRGNSRNGLMPDKLNPEDQDFKNAERNLLSDRKAKRRSEAAVIAERAALRELETERVACVRDVAQAAESRMHAIEAVIVEEASQLLAEARAAEQTAAIKRAELKALDGLFLAVAGMKPRMLLADSAIAANRELIKFLRAPLPESAPSHEQKAIWKALMQCLEMDATASIGGEAVAAAAVAIKPPAAAFLGPQMRWEDTSAYRSEVTQVAQATPPSPQPISVRPSPPPAPEPRFEDSELAKRPWAQPQGEPLTQQRYEDSPEYVAQRAQFLTLRN